ncbi:SEN1 N terminal-domain-containing protein [Lipomyces oligophaga]|uniref:SEN1 N terminal-domain-containing protein n=1 Tax=Lipomyces oligophaga TaxID=45792 RepID=UPI0034CD60F9
MGDTSKGSDSGPSDSELQRVTAIVLESKKEDDVALQERALQESISYLMSLPVSGHFFCNRDRSLIAANAMQLFAFDNTPELEWLKKTLGGHLKNCHLCVKGYHQAKEPMRLAMIEEGIDQSDMEGFMKTIEAWDIERVSATLTPFAEQFKIASADKSAKFDASLIAKSYNIIYECLCAPYLPIESESIGNAFRTLFVGIQSGGRFIRLNELIPGMISFLFTKDPGLVKWAEKSLGLLSRQVTDNEFDSCLQRAYHDCIGGYQHFRNKTILEVSTFWNAMAKSLKVLSKEVIIKHLCGNNLGRSGTGHDIVKLAWFDFQNYPACITSMLSVFTVLFSILGKDIWSMSTPFLPTSVTDIVFGQTGGPAFEMALRESNGHQRTLTHLLAWVWPYLETVSGSAKLKVGELIITNLLGRYQDPILLGPSNHQTRSMCLKCGFKTLAGLLEPSDINILQKAKSFTNSADRIIRRDARKISESYATLIIEHATIKNYDEELRSAAFESLIACVLADCLSATEECELMITDIVGVASMRMKQITPDVLSAAQDEAENDKFGNPELGDFICFGEKLWTTLVRRFPEDDHAFAKALIGAFGKSRIYLVETLDNIKSSNQSYGGAAATSLIVKLVSYKIQRYQQLSDELDSLLKSIGAILQHIGDFNAQILQQNLVTDEYTVHVLLGCSLSSHLVLSGNGLEIIKQAFDASGRMEALKGLFNSNTSMLLDAYVTTLQNTGCFPVRLGLGPIPKLIRMTMDLSSLLFDPRDGYIASHNSIIPDIEVKRSAQSVWTYTWRSLTLVIGRTLLWAKLYPRDIMVDYMRDILELSSLLFANSQLLEQGLAGKVEGSGVDIVTISPSKPTKMGVDILVTTIDSLREMTNWLNLSDDALRQMCVSLICDILDRLYQSHVDVPIGILKKLEKYASQSGSRVYLLDDNQRYDVVAAISKFDVGLIRNTPPDAASETYRDISEVIAIPDDENMLVKSETESISNSSKAKNTIDSWLLKGEQAKVPEVKRDETDPDKMRRRNRIEEAFKRASKEEQAMQTKNLSTIRRELLESRQKSATPQRESVVVHAPRPPGFRVSGTVGAAPMSKSTTSVTSKLATSAVTNASDEDSSDGSDDDIDSLFSLSKHSRPTMKVNNALPIAPQPLRSGIGIGGSNRRLGHQAPSINEKEQAERNMRARLRVNMDPLYQRILRWDYHSEAELPSDEIGSDMSKYRPIPSKFSTAMEYRAVFEPLLMLEAVQSIAKSKIEKMDKPFKLSITNRASCDDYIEVYSSIETQQLAQVKLGEADVIVITFVPDDQFASAGTGRKPRWPDSKYLNCLAKIKDIKRSPNAELSDVVFRCLPSSELARQLLPKSELNGLRVVSMTTIEREFSSLHGLPYYDLLDPILQAKPASLIRADVAKIRRAQSIYNVNAPQAGAIIAAMESRGFTLIQGPPGTGKTKTILGIIGATLSTTKSRGMPINIPGQRAPEPKVPAPVEQKRILVCAPSNAAVDELVLRLKGGIRNSTGSLFFPKIVRLGRSDIINPAVRDLTLEEQVDAEVAKFEDEQNKKKGVDKVDRQSLREQLNKVLAERAELDLQINNCSNSAERDQLRAQRDILHARKSALGQRLDEERDKLAVAVRTSELERRSIQARLVTGAEVVCATLSGAGHELLATLALTFETVIVDEAAQCVELSALIPLKYGCLRCAMVGDPNQLPPTVLSQTAAKFLYEQSLFVRMQKNFPSSVHLLSIQYRMHPAISIFPSSEFYQSRLIDGDAMADTAKAEWHKSGDAFGPYRFIDVHSKEQISKTHSYSNHAEAICALTLYQRLVSQHPHIDFDGRIGIVTPYKEQLRELKNTFRSALGEPGIAGIDFNTIDGFQGQEKEIIILSCVRAQPVGQSKGVGFIADVRRMNVALTRAKSSLWIIGNVNSLVMSNVWRRLIDDAEKRGLVSFFNGREVVPRAPAPKEVTQQFDGGSSRIPHKRPHVKTHGEKQGTKKKVDIDGNRGSTK